MRSVKLAIASLVLLLVATRSADAVSLVVMATNTTAIASQKVYTIGVLVTSADLAAPGVGPHPTLSIHNLTIPFTAGVGPYQAAGANNKPDVQAVQATFDGNNFPDPPAGNTLTQIYKDSWWYSSGGANGGAPGLLNGYVDQDFNTGTITTNAVVGPLGYVWHPIGSGIQGGAANTSITFSGTYGPDGANALDLAPLASQFSSGVLTVPLLQVVMSGTTFLPYSYSTGDQGISVGNNLYNWLGRSYTDPSDCNGMINYLENNMGGLCPEPSSWLLLALGSVALAVANRSRWRAHLLRSPRVSHSD